MFGSTVAYFTLLIIVALSADEGQMSPAEIQYCCNLVSDMEECHTACMKFASNCPPSVQNKTAYLTNYCTEIPNELDLCLQNTNLSNAQSKPTPSPELIACCNTSQNKGCRDVCVEKIYEAKFDEPAIEAVIDECGPIPVDPVWTCFFEFADKSQPTEGSSVDENYIRNCSSNSTIEVTAEPPLTITYADWPRLDCCSRANSTECREACNREYTGNRIEGTWEKLNLDCKYQPTEDDLAVCLDDVASQCNPGCTDLDFCQSFNNRPLQLFRDCTGSADQEAEKTYKIWKGGVISLPLVTFQIKDVTTCLPELWKAASCAIYTRPCDNVTHSSLICKNDCLHLLNECLSPREYLAADEICEILSPSHLQERCMPIRQFTEPSSDVLSDVITAPCTDSPCADGLHCIINHDCIGNEDKSCRPYSCIKESLLGKKPTLSMAEIDTVHVTSLPGIKERCYGYVYKGSEGFGQQLMDLSNQYCQALALCSIDGKNYSHGDIFYQSDGCNFCTCYHGSVQCTNQSCISSTSINFGSAPTLLESCNCPSFYSPVCTTDGRTIPNPCIAQCLGYSSEHYTQGSCSSDPCDQATCPEGTKCVPRHHVCLGVNSTIKCPQYSCETYGDCVKYKSPVCDTNNDQHKDVCTIFLSKMSIEYFGYCQTECSSDRSQSVCGVNGETFSTKCHAFQVGMAVDYIGECSEFPHGSSGCTQIKCPGVYYFSTNETCDGPIPPGACCPHCGSQVRVIVDKKSLERSRKAMKTSSINSTDIIERMRSLLKVVECRLDGYLALDGSFVFLLTPTNYSSFLNVDVCNVEATRLSALINNHTPIVTADPYLHFLVAAIPSHARIKASPPLNVRTIDEPSGCGLQTPIQIMFLFLLILTLYAM